MLSFANELENFQENLSFITRLVGTISDVIIPKVHKPQ